jgi:hypothetical protein
MFHKEKEVEVECIYRATICEKKLLGVVVLICAGLSLKPQH